MLDSETLNIDILDRDGLSKLLYASWLINSDLNSKAKLWKIQDHIKSLLQCADCYLFIYDKGSQSLTAQHYISHQQQPTLDSNLFSRQPSESSRSSDVTVPSILDTSAKDSLSQFKGLVLNDRVNSSASESVHVVSPSIEPSMKSHNSNQQLVHIKLSAVEGIPAEVLLLGHSVWTYTPAGTHIVLPLRSKHESDSVSNCSSLPSRTAAPSASTLRTQIRNHSAPPHLRSDSMRLAQSPLPKKLKLEELKFLSFSSLGVPVFDEKGVVAVLQAFNKSTLPIIESSLQSSTLRPLAENETDVNFCKFTEADEVMLKYFARIVGETLRSAEVLRDAEVSRDRAAGLLNLLQSLKQNLGIQSALLTLSTHARQLVRAAQCVVYAIERRNKEMPFLLSLSSDSGKELKIALSPNNSILYNSATFGKTVVISDARENHEVAEMLLQMSQEPISSLSSPRLSHQLPNSRSPTVTPVALGACPTSVLPLFGVRTSVGSCASDTDSDVSNYSRRRNRNQSTPFSGPINNLAVVPIKAENQTTIGLIQLANKVDEDGNILPFTDEDMQILEMFGSLVGPRLERTEFGLKATGGRQTEAGRANSAPVKDRSRRPSLSTPSEPAIREESDDDDLGTLSGSDSSPSSNSWIGRKKKVRPFGVSSMERLSRISERL